MERSQGVWSAGRRNGDIRCHTKPGHWYSCDTAGTTSFAWKLHYLVVVCCWAYGNSTPFCLATKHQQDPADYYPSSVKKHLGCQEMWKRLKPMSLIRLTHTSYAPHVVLCCEGGSHSSLRPGKTRGLKTYPPKHRRQTERAVSRSGAPSHSPAAPRSYFCRSASRVTGWVEPLQELITESVRNSNHSSEILISVAIACWQYLSKKCRATKSRAM